MKKLIIIFNILTIFFLGYAPLSHATSYEQMENKVGCKSKYSDSKKEDIFNSKYRGKNFTWSGVVFDSDKGEVSLNLDGFGMPDLTVYFSDGHTGYDLLEDEEITVKFRMKSLGGCFLPHEGVDGILQ